MEKENQPENKNVLLMPKGFFAGYFPECPGLEEQDFYLVPTKEIKGGVAGKEYVTQDVVRGAKGEIFGLPALQEGESWFTLVGPDGRQYATKSGELTSKALEANQESFSVE